VDNRNPVAQDLFRGGPGAAYWRCQDPYLAPTFCHFWAFGDNVDVTDAQLARAGAACNAANAKKAKKCDFVREIRVF
jgi:hypothetical protein